MMTEQTPEMSTEDTATETEPTQQDPPQNADEAAEISTEDTDGADAKLRREAARYRRSLREAETERDGLRGRVEAMQRAEVERLVADQIAVPADVWLAGTSLPDMLDEDGNVDQAKVADRIGQILTERPGWRRQSAPSFDGGVRATAPNTGPTWADALRAKP